MRTRAAIILLITTINYADTSGFLNFSKDELCVAEPHLEMCRTKNLARSSKSLSSRGLTPERLAELAKDEAKQGFVPQSDAETDDPFSDIVTRSPVSSDPSYRHHRRKHYRSLNEYYRHKQSEYYSRQANTHNRQLYGIYPGMHPKDQSYCSDLQPNFAFTCQPSKPLRIDLVEFCKDYSAFCGVPNVHQLPGPRLGPPPEATGVGHVGVSGKFGFGVGAVPGLEVGVGWGVDVGPIPGMGESVGVNVGLDLGIMGSNSPESYRRGQGPGKSGNGIVGINGGVGVNPGGGAGPIGVGTGLGVGK